MNHWFRAVLSALFALMGAAMPATGQKPGVETDTVTLSLTDARRLAVSQNPAFLAEGIRREIAAGELRQARLYQYNPQVDIESPGLFNTGGVEAYEAVLSQEVEWAGQRGLRIEAAEIGRERADLLVADAGRTVLADVSVAFYATLAAQRRLEIASKVLALNERLSDAVRVQVREGEISLLEGNLAEIEVGRARARVLAARREATSAALELARLTGIQPDVAVIAGGALPDLPSPTRLESDSLVAAALRGRPDVAASAAAVRRSEGLTQLARREAIPNLRISARAEREVASGEPRLGVGFGLVLPAWNRNQGLIAQREAETEQITLGRQALELAVRTQVTDAYRAYVTASEEARVLEQDVLGPARQNQGLLDTAYVAGKIDLAALVLLRNQLLDAELGYWDAWLAQREALVRLEAATGALAIQELIEGNR